MEIMRRLARGELSEILGEKTIKLDRLFRTLRLHEHAQKYAQKVDQSSAPAQALLAYLDGINQYQEKGAKPLEFEMLGWSEWKVDLVFWLVGLIGSGIYLMIWG